MNVRSLGVAALGAVMAVSAAGEPMRPLFTKENKFPKVGQYEVGTMFELTEMQDNLEQYKLSDANLWELSPYARYMATENVALEVAVPFGGLDPDAGSSEAGLGDVRFGVALRAHEHIYRFPYIIPHASLRLDTGDDDVGIGAGESSLLVGTTIGSTMYDTDWHFMLDVGYELFEDSENVLSAGGAVIYDVNERYSLLAQGQVTNEETRNGDDENPVRIGGAMLYKPSDRLTLGAYGTGAKNSREDVIATIRVSYDL